MADRDGRPEFTELMASELPAVAAADDEHALMVTHQIDGGELTHVFDASDGLGSVADSVAQAEDAEAPLAGDIC